MPPPHSPALVPFPVREPVSNLLRYLLPEGVSDDIRDMGAERGAGSREVCEGGSDEVGEEDAYGDV